VAAAAPGGLAALRRQPLLHFVAIGAALFAIDRAWEATRPPPAPLTVNIPAPQAERQRIAIEAAQLARLRDDFVRQFGRPPTRDEWLGVATLAIDEAILEAEARRLGLGIGDPAIDRRLVQKMRAVSARPDAGDAELLSEARRLGLDDDLIVQRLLREKLRLALRSHPDDAMVDDAAIAAHLERHRDRYQQPAWVSFAHVFVSTSRRGKEAEPYARTLLARLRAGVLPPASEDLSDAFPLGLGFREQPEDALATRFGEAFARSVSRAPLNAWSGPHASSLGLHLVRATARGPASLPPIEAVRERATLEIRESRAQARLDESMRQLRQDYGAAKALAAVSERLEATAMPASSAFGKAP
jgi:hypothetical protein